MLRRRGGAAAADESQLVPLVFTLAGHIGPAAVRHIKQSWDQGVALRPEEKRLRWARFAFVIIKAYFRVSCKYWAAVGRVRSRGPWGGSSAPVVFDSILSAPFSVTEPLLA